MTNPSMNITDVCGGLRQLHGGFQSAAFGEFEIRTAFQPIYTLEQGLSRLYGVEALARPLQNGRPVQPVDFFRSLDPATAFEADWVCMAVHLVNAAAWDMPSARLFINLNPTVCHLMVQSEELFDEFASMARRLGVNPELIVCEITESRSGSDEALAVLGRKLRSLGFSIAIDRFGPTNSNLVRLIELEPSIVKIDPVWFKHMLTRPHQHELAHKLMHRLNDIGAEVLIQGVETAEEYRWARSCPAAYIQGHLFGPATHFYDLPSPVDNLSTDHPFDTLEVNDKVA